MFGPFSGSPLSCPASGLCVGRLFPLLPAGWLGLVTIVAGEHGAFAHRLKQAWGQITSKSSPQPQRSEMGCFLLSDQKTVFNNNSSNSSQGSELSSQPHQSLDGQVGVSPPFPRCGALGWGSAVACPVGQGEGLGTRRPRLC